MVRLVAFEHLVEKKNRHKVKRTKRHEHHEQRPIFMTVVLIYQTFAIMLRKHIQFSVCGCVGPALSKSNQDILPVTAAAAVSLEDGKQRRSITISK